VISDIHGNLHALEAVLSRIEGMGINEIICLGDIVGYGPYPGRCVDLVVKCCSTVVRGNHDDAVINPEREMEFNGPARTAIAWTRGVLGPLHLDALCRIREIEELDKTVMCIHDSPADAPTDYVHDAGIAAGAFSGFALPVCLLGHTHVPMIFEAPADSDGALTALEVTARVPRAEEPLAMGGEFRYICNPGSVGQPRDADPRARHLHGPPRGVQRRGGPGGDPPGGAAHGARRPPRHRRVTFRADCVHAQPAD
jgi:predicted phosphodiesterase